MHKTGKADKVQPLVQNYIVLKTKKITLIGVYHFSWMAGEVGFGLGGLGWKGSSGSSGSFTTAFFAFSNLAPSSVDPLSPQRT